MKTIRPDGWPRPSGYSDAMAAGGTIIAVSGQIGWDPVTHRLAGDGFLPQARQALANIVAILHAGGAAPGDCVRLTWFISDREAYRRALPALGEAYREIFGGHYPAMSVLVVAGFIEPGAQLEIEATAVLPAAGR